ncbi:MAG: pentapeptide repeat-containing protein [Okeania sp. SIO2C9]|uniref:pentapeptide repeat-containing protein n=1 Tax=Okeania sp. SIO2C9 TaxID=2607791 RepID=UPI0013C1508E|nr:pentapeptide repeat-containing protein [Okeania sp. SIO2C9]NEQ72184.1 pentapeptide repeat-containing protein [Okeania sp. SIO2C9]
MTCKKIMGAEELRRRYALGERDFQELDILKADWTGGKLEYANLTGADLSGANLRKGFLRAIRLTLEVQI